MTRGLYEDLHNLLTNSISDLDYDMSRGLDDYSFDPEDTVEVLDA